MISYIYVNELKCDIVVESLGFYGQFYGCFHGLAEILFYGTIRIGVVDIRGGGVVNGGEEHWTWLYECLYLSRSDVDIYRVKQISCW